MSTINTGELVLHEDGPNAGMYQGVVTDQYGHTVATTLCFSPDDQDEAQAAADALFAKLKA